MADEATEEPKADVQPETPKYRPRYRSFLAALIVSLIFYFAFGNVVPIQDTERYFVDYRLRSGRLSTLNTNLVYVSVDRVSYNQDFSGSVLTNATDDDRYFMEVLRGEFPWNREVFAGAVDQLAQLGASKIILNFTFAVEKPEDPEMKKVLDRHADKVLLGASFELNPGMLAFIYPSPTLIERNESGDMHDQRVGFVTVHTDADGVARRGLYDLSMNQLAKDNLGMPDATFPEELIYHSFSSRIIRSLDRGDELPPPSIHPLLRFTGPRGTFATISFKDIFDPVVRQANFEQTGFFKGKTVIIGPAKAVLPEQYRTPFRFGDATMDGSELHLNYLNAALQGELIDEFSQAADQALVLAAGALLLLLSFFVSSPIKRIVGGALLAGAWLVIAFWQYNQHNVMIGAVITPMALLVVGGMISALFDRPEVSPSTARSEP
ncbi:MAG: CHASE2 domain-containing protein [Limisphaerales bacterium]